MRTVFLGRDNTFDLFLEADGLIIDANTFTRFALYMLDRKTAIATTIDSSSAPAGTFTSVATRFYRNANRVPLRCMLGLGSFGLTAAHEYDTWVRVYNASYPEGLVWGDHNGNIRVRVDSGQ